MPYFPWTYDTIHENSLSVRVAMVLKEFFGMDPGWNTQVLATDLSTRVLKHAMEGKYLAEQIVPLPDKWKRKYFTRISNEAGLLPFTDTCQVMLYLFM